jgi:hypothetical protein
MTLLAEAKVQGSRESGRGASPETDGRLKQNLAYHLPAHLKTIRRGVTLPNNRPSVPHKLSAFRDK